MFDSRLYNVPPVTFPLRNGVAWLVCNTVYTMRGLLLMLRSGPVRALPHKACSATSDPTIIIMRNRLISQAAARQPSSAWWHLRPSTRQRHHAAAASSSSGVRCASQRQLHTSIRAAASAAGGGTQQPSPSSPSTAAPPAAKRCAQPPVVYDFAGWLCTTVEKFERVAHDLGWITFFFFGGVVLMDNNLVKATCVAAVQHRYHHPLPSLPPPWLCAA